MMRRRGRLAKEAIVCLVGTDPQAARSNTMRGLTSCYFIATLSVPSLAAMSSADVAGFTSLSIAMIFPSLPM